LHPSTDEEVRLVATHTMAGPVRPPAAHSDRKVKLSFWRLMNTVASAPVKLKVAAALALGAGAAAVGTYDSGTGLAAPLKSGPTAEGGSPDAAVPVTSSPCHVFGDVAGLPPRVAGDGGKGWGMAEEETARVTLAAVMVAKSLPTYGKGKEKRERKKREGEG
jgi:hypothetical protein